MSGPRCVDPDPDPVVRTFCADGRDPPDTRIVVVAGTHGNEPAGAMLVTRWLVRFGHVLGSWLRPGVELVFVPALNPCGLQDGVREAPGEIDLNRQYGLSAARAGRRVQAVRALIEQGPRRTWVIDLHEGWGWAAEPGSRSMGSALYFGGGIEEGDDTHIRLDALLAVVNKYHQAANHGFPFLLRPDPPQGPRGTLGEWVAGLQNGTGYLLLETTGQNNIQPLARRMAQVHTILRGLLVNVLGAADDRCRTCGHATFQDQGRGRAGFPPTPEG